MPQKNPSARLDHAVKVHPKLKMIANGNAVVNAIRAEHSGCVAVTNSKLLGRVTEQRADDSTPVTRAALPRALVKLKHLRAVASEVSASVFVTTRRAEHRAIRGQTAQRERMITAQVPLDRLREVAADPNVVFIEPAEALATPAPVVTTEAEAAPLRTEREVPHRALHRNGADVLVGIIDVEGFDFAHPDFLDAQGRTRFIRIWDQGGAWRPSPARFGYGAEFTDAQLNAAIDAAPRLKVPPQDIEQQSQRVPGSHATHVASIAAGNLGVARNAVIAGVLISLPAGDYDRRKSFYDSTRVAHAVDYLLRLGEQLKLPVAINVSLGTNGGAHDGSSAISRWIDAALTRPGCALCVAAGNAGQERALHATDLGYVMGRIHTSGQIGATGLSRDIQWNVIGNGRSDISENELEIWYSAQDKFAVSVRPPGGKWIGPVEPRQFVQNRRLEEDGVLSIYNELYNPANGANYVAVYLSPLMTEAGVVGIPSGTWTVRLHGKEVRDGRYNGWIERDDPRPRGKVKEQEFWSFPSFFSERSNVDNSSVSSLACGQRVVAVANLHVATETINITSSEGPTRDGRFKPDIAAPGTDINAAKGFAGSGDLWVSMTGTSMASPYACGVAALMLATRPDLTAAQIEAIMRRTARPLPGAAYAWAKSAGYGRIDPGACILEAKHFDQREELT